MNLTQLVTIDTLTKNRKAKVGFQIFKIIPRYSKVKIRTRQRQNKNQQYEQKRNTNLDKLMKE